jgi:hypothetical protein
MKQNREFVYHSKAPQAGYRATAAGHIDENGDLWVAAALCSPEDNFVKRIGHNKALGRSYSNTTAKNMNLGDVSYKDNKFVLYCLRMVAGFVQETKTTDLFRIFKLNREYLQATRIENTEFSKVESVKGNL